MARLGKLRIHLQRFLFTVESWIVRRLVEPILYKLIGVSRHRKQIRSGKETELTAELMDVILKYPEAGWSAVYVNQTAIHLHRKFIKPEYVLQPHIKLMTYEDGLAYFAVCSPNDTIYDVDKYPFLFLALPECCKQVVTMPLSELAKLGERIGAPLCDISLIFHLTRCGSTALGQALNNLPGYTVLSESRFWLACYSELLAKNGQEYGESEECQKLYQASLNVVLKDFSSETKLIIRAIGGCDHEFLLPHAIKHWPGARIIFMYRDVKGVVNSMWRTIGPKMEDVFNNMVQQAKTSEVSRERLLAHVVVLSCSLDPDALACGDELTQARLLLLGWVTNMKYFKKYGKDVKKLMMISFEEFVTDNQNEVAKVLRFLDIPQTYLTLALDALSEDSQKGTMLSQASLKDAIQWNPDTDTCNWCEMICKKYDLPPFGNKFKIRPDLTFDIDS